MKGKMIGFDAVAKHDFDLANGAVRPPHALLAPLRPEAVFYQLRVREMPFERLAAGWSQLVRRVVER